MPLTLYANDATTTATGSSGTTSPGSGTPETWTVASSASFPAAVTGVSQFHVADAASGMQSEIVTVTNVSGTTWSVTRGAESTVPVAHSAGFTIWQVVSAADYTALATTTYADADAAAVAYSDAMADGYAAWTFNPNSSAVTTSSANLLLAWPAGAINVTKLVLPTALTAINGFLSWVWRAGTGTAMANCYIGFFGLTGTQIANSPNQAALGSSLQRMSLGVTSLAAGTYWVTTVIGTQGGTNAGGPLMAAGEVSSGGYAPHTGYTGAVRGSRLTGSATATPASLTISGGAISGGYVAALYANGWFAID